MIKGWVDKYRNLLQGDLKGKGRERERGRGRGRGKGKGKGEGEWEGKGEWVDKKGKGKEGPRELRTPLLHFLMLAYPPKPIT